MLIAHLRAFICIISKFIAEFLPWDTFVVVIVGLLPPPSIQPRRPITFESGGVGIFIKAAILFVTICQQCSSVPIGAPGRPFVPVVAWGSATTLIIIYTFLRRTRFSFC